MITLEKNKPLILKIGKFQLYILNKEAEFESGFLPDRTEQFALQKEFDDCHNDIYLVIEKECLVEQPKDKIVDNTLSGSLRYIMYQINEEQYLWTQRDFDNNIGFVYKISDHWCHWRLISKLGGFSSFDDLSYLFAYSILPKRGIMLHGVIMEWKGNGIIFTAYSGVGKTTHTGIWKEHEDVKIINGDRALCCWENEKWYTYGCPWCGSSEDCSTDKLPLKAIVILEQSSENRVEGLPPLLSFLELAKHAFAPDWNSTLMNLAMDAIENIITTIPVLKLSCRPDLGSVEVLKRKMEELII